MPLLRRSTFSQTKCRTMTISMKVTYLCLSSFVLLFFPSLLLLLFSHFASNDLKTGKEKNSTGLLYIVSIRRPFGYHYIAIFYLFYILHILFSISTKILDIRLSDKRPLPQEFSIPKDEKILLDNNKPLPNCISIYGGLVNRP